MTTTPNKDANAPKTMAPKPAAAKAADAAKETPTPADKPAEKPADKPAEEPKTVTPEADKPDTGTEEAKEVGKTVETDAPAPATENKSIDVKDYEGNPNIGSSEGTKPAESPSHAGNERDVDDGAGGVRATMGNQSLATVMKPGTPNSPDSTNRDVPADATRAEAAALTRAPADHKEENYPDDDSEYNPYEGVNASDEVEIARQLDNLDEDEQRRQDEIKARREANTEGQKPYITPVPEARRNSPVGNYLRFHQNKPDEFIVYGLGDKRLTIGDLRGEGSGISDIVRELRKRGKKDNFPISMGEGPRLTLEDIDD